MSDPLVARLRAAGCVWAEDEAIQLRAATSDPEQLAELVARRIAGEPLELVVGRVGFAGVTLATAPGVFVPRARSGALVAAALAAVASSPGAAAAHVGAPIAGGVAGAEPLLVLDLCCGSGALGAAFAAGCDRPVTLHATDVSPAAVALARANLADVPGAAVWHGDLYEPLPVTLHGRVDVLLANAPYVPTGEMTLLPREARDWEERVALDGGTDGLDVHRRVLAGAPQWLAADGVLLVEVSRRQAAPAGAVAAAAGLGVVEAAGGADETTVVLVCRRS